MSQDVRCSVNPVPVCRFIGHEYKVGQKRNPSKSTKPFASPFQDKVYTQHHTGKHPARWGKYFSLLEEENASFFISAIPVANEILNQFSRNFDHMYCHFYVAVIDVITQRLSIDSEDAEETVQRALSVLVAQLDVDGSVTQY